MREQAPHIRNKSFEENLVEVRFTLTDPNITLTDHNITLTDHNITLTDHLSGKIG